MKEKFKVTGMTCSACSSHVEKEVSHLSGVNNVSVSLLTNSMMVEYDENKTDASAIIERVSKAGYLAEQYKTEKTENKSIDKESENIHKIKSMKNRLIVSFAFLIPLMYISMGEMVGLSVPTFFSAHKNPLNYAFVQFLLSLPILYINRNYYISGFKRLFLRAPNMDTLIAIGSMSSVLYGIYNIFQIGNALSSKDISSAMHFSMNLYFESGAMILTLITLGKFFEERSKGKTGAAISALIELAPDTALVYRNGEETEIPSSDVLVGDIVVVKPGMSIPVDGTIVFGETAIDESAITGESIPCEKSVGDNVTGGTINKSGYIRFEAKRVGSDTTLSSIISLVEEASSGKAPISRLADKIAGVFVPIVILVALITMVVWLVIGADFEFSMSCAISVLVISCPCALGLATPVAIMVGTGKGATGGILIKSGEALQTLQSIKTVVLDKTGTITEGKPSVTDVFALNDDAVELVKIAGSLEKQSEHPLSLAICDYAENNGIETDDASEFSAIFGKGVRGKIDGKEYFAGNLHLMKENNIDTENVLDIIKSCTDKGQTPVLISDEEKVIGIFAIEDKVKENAKVAAKRLSDMGISVLMLTGDNMKTASVVANSVGIKNVIAEVLPEDKESKIQMLQENGEKVSMVGDGINDAPALARADVGIAIGAGTHIAIESADVILVRNDLLDVVSAIRLSKKVIKNIKENLFWAFFYNMIGIPIAAGVFYPIFGLKLSPMIGALAMSLSSVCVVLNALRLFKFRPETLNEITDTQNNKGELKMEILIEGMACGHCTARVEKVLNEIDGVSAEVSLEKKTAFVTCDESILQEQLTKAIENAGYTVISVK